MCVLDVFIFPKITFYLPHLLTVLLVLVLIVVGAHISASNYQVIVYRVSVTNSLSYPPSNIPYGGMHACSLSHKTSLERCG